MAAKAAGVAQAAGHQPSLAELCQPPAGYRFGGGVWTTHDLDLAAVSDVAGPALLNLSSADPARRRQAVQSRGWDEGPLAILYPASRPVRPGPAVPPWIFTVPVPPPLLHAKLLILQFAALSGSGLVTRALVTSANLTHSGMRRNREIHVWEDSRRGSGPALAADLLVPLRALAVEIRSSAAAAEVVQRASWARDWIDSLADAGNLGPARARNALVHSIDKQADLARVLPQEQARRLVVVSPAFASDTSHQPVSYLGGRIGPGTAVDFYAPLEEGKDGGGSRPVMATAVRRVLDERGCELRLWGIPEVTSSGDDEDPLAARGRRLHAKLIAVVHDRPPGRATAHVLAGSANFTHRGVGGHNRESMARLTITEDALDDFLVGLDARRYDRSSPAGDREDSTEKPLPYVGATFRPNLDQGWEDASWRGELTLDWDQRPVSISYGVTPVSRTRGPQAFTLHRRRGTLKVVFSRVEPVDVPIQLDGLDGLGIAPDEDGQLPAAELLALLRLGRRKRSTSKTTPSSGVGTSSPTDDERIDYPLVQPLSILVRRRQDLRSRWTSDLASNLRAAIESDTSAGTAHNQAAVQCALAIAGAYNPAGPVRPADTLLLALVNALLAEDRKG